MDGFDMNFEGHMEDLPDAVKKRFAMHMEMKKMMHGAQYQLSTNFKDEIRKEIDYASGQLLDLESKTGVKKLRAYFTLIGIAKMLAGGDVPLDYFCIAAGMFLGMDDKISNEPEHVEGLASSMLCAEKTLRMMVDHLYSELDVEWRTCDGEDCDGKNCDCGGDKGEDDE